MIFICNRTLCNIFFYVFHISEFFSYPNKNIFCLNRGVRISEDALYILLEKMYKSFINSPKISLLGKTSKTAIFRSFHDQIYIFSFAVSYQLKKVELNLMVS